MIAKYPAGMEPDKEGTVMYSDFTLENQWFSAMDSARMHDFSFNEAVSFQITCRDESELDYYWNTLSAVPEAEQCGWVKDKYGVSWQIIPERLMELLENDPENKVLNAMLEMKKIDINKLEEASKS
jgi:predicted 3-demethylubiquinone-9 3-methyltransferase (glyoxalase superfamily)